MRPTLAFVRDRLASMAERPSAWADGAEASAKAQDAFARFVAQRTGAVDRNPVGPYR